MPTPFLISVITPAYNVKLPLLMEAWQSLADSSDLGEWQWEWCLQEDGPATLESHLPSDPRIRYDSMNTHVGAAATRNAAIARTRGEWIVNLDYDDFFLPKGLGALIQAWTTYPQAIWAAGRAHDYIDEDKQFVEFPNYLEDGVVSGQQALDALRSAGVFPVHTAGVAYKADVLRAIGGYFASPLGEDVVTWIAATQLGRGVYTSEPVFAYRRWSGQSTKQATTTEWVRDAWLDQRVEAMRNLGLTGFLDK